MFNPLDAQSIVTVVSKEFDRASGLPDIAKGLSTKLGRIYFYYWYDPHGV